MLGSCQIGYFFETILGCESEAQGEMFDEKKQCSKISSECPFKWLCHGIVIPMKNEVWNEVWIGIMSSEQMLKGSYLNLDIRA